MPIDATLRKQWTDWLRHYGPEKFYDAFVHIAQDAKGQCLNCGHPIFLDIVEGGGGPDWKTQDGDYGCELSPETTEEGVGSHVPVKLNDHLYRAR